MTVDKSSIGGIVLAVGGILAGLLLEGGNLRQVLQPTAAMIVFGGTIGAVMLQFPLPVVLNAVRRLRAVFVPRQANPQSTVQRLVGYAQKARREGIVSLDADLNEIEDPFLKKSLMLAVDGTEPDELRKIMELELDNQAEYEEQVPQVFAVQRDTGVVPRHIFAFEFPFRLKGAGFQECDQVVQFQQVVLDRRGGQKENKFPRQGIDQPPAEGRAVL